MTSLVRKPPPWLRVAVFNPIETNPEDRCWVCEDCAHYLQVPINPVECPACGTGEMMRAPVPR